MKTSKINPLSKDLLVEVGREVTDVPTYIRNKQKYDDDGKIPTTYLERADKVIMYTNPNIRAVLNKLSGSASKLFIWIMQSIIYGEDFFKFNSKRFLKETGMSPATLVKVKKELIDNSIIAEMQNVNKYYWINPVIIFKGNRVKKYPNNLISYKNITGGTTSDSKIK